MSLWYSILGYVNIKIDGLSTEKFLNLIGQHDIKIWDVKRISRTSLTASIKRNDFKKLQLLMRKQSMSLQVLQKRGFAKHFKFLRMRNVFVLLVPIVLVFIYAVTSFIWVIDIKGVSGSDIKKITASLENCGVKVGMPIDQVDQKEYQRIILKENPDLTWVGVNVIGVKLEISAVKEDAPKSIVDKSTPSNIVANKDGIIYSIITYDGTAKVEVGSTFRKGDILISGIMEHTVALPRYVCARGTIEARVYYEATVNATELSKKQRTGKTKTINYIEIGNMLSPIGNTTIDYKYYECEINKEVLTDSFFIPLCLVKKNVYELELIDVAGEKSQYIREQAEALAYEKALSQVPKAGAKILGSNTTFSSNDKGDLLATVSIQSLENVGETIAIEGAPKIEDPTVSP